MTKSLKIIIGIAVGLVLAGAIYSHVLSSRAQAERFRNVSDHGLHELTVQDLIEPGLQVNTW